MYDLFWNFYQIYQLVPYLFIICDNYFDFFINSYFKNFMGSIN
jgi:hypothetical protein